MCKLSLNIFLKLISQPFYSWSVETCRQFDVIVTKALLNAIP